MPIRVEIYAAGGIAVGTVAHVGHLRDALEAGGSLRVDAATWHPLDETDTVESAELTLPPDDVFIATAEEAHDLPVHAQWHDIVLHVGPYHVLGQLATMPGFDPGRALARPTGEFVQLRDVTISLLEEEGTGLPRPMALVNRYVVDRVEADLMLGFFFPGAVMISTKPEEPEIVTSTPSSPMSSSPATTAEADPPAATEAPTPAADAPPPATDAPAEAAPAATSEPQAAAPPV